MADKQDKMRNDFFSGKSEKGRLYKPTSKLAELASTFQSVKSVKEEDKPDRPGVENLI